MKSEQRIWTPRRSVGGIAFGDSEESLAKHLLERMLSEERDCVGWNVYGFNDSIRVYCEHGLVTSIAVYDSLFYGELNVIGLDFSVLARTFSEQEFVKDEKIELSDGWQTPVSCDELGLLVWLNRDDCVVSCCCDNGL